MKNKTIAKLTTIIFLLSMVLAIGPIQAASSTDGLYVTVIMTVEGTIDTYDNDPHEWHDPMYYFWIDANGDPNDGGWDNGHGTYQTGIRLGNEWTQIDSPKLNFWGPGLDGSVGTADDEYFFIPETVPGVSKTWIGNGVAAQISEDGKSLIVTFPLSKIGSPNTLEVSFMAQDTTSSSDDNLHPTIPYSQGWQGWIGYPTSIDATMSGSYSKLDAAAESISTSFDITKGEVIIHSLDAFVTGGGWIDSPAGAYKPDPTLEGRASFGFVSKYKKKEATPSGETQFIFQVADLNFHSTSYDWLVITNSKAQYKGSGTINGEGDYGFMLTANDGGKGGVDTFRIKIVDKATDTVIYDNGVDTELQGGSVVIHKN